MEMSDQAFAADFYGLPSYFVTHHRAEIFGQNVRIYHWEKRGSILAPQYMCILSATDLAFISQDVRDIANRALIEQLPEGLLSH